MGSGDLGALGAVAFSPAHGSAIDAVFWEFICELVFVLQVLFEAAEFRFEFLGDCCHCGLSVQILLLARIRLQIEEFPTVHLPVVNEFVSGGSHAVMRSRVVVSGVVVVSVVH